MRLNRKLQALIRILKKCVQSCIYLFVFFGSLFECILCFLWSLVNNWFTAVVIVIVRRNNRKLSPALCKYGFDVLLFIYPTLIVNNSTLTLFLHLNIDNNNNNNARERGRYVLCLYIDRNQRRIILETIFSKHFKSYEFLIPFQVLNLTTYAIIVQRVL